MRMTARERYTYDPLFRYITDTLRHLLLQKDVNGTQFTATEVREAAMLACEMYEYENIKPMLICTPKLEAENYE